MLAEKHAPSLLSSENGRGWSFEPARTSEMAVGPCVGERAVARELPPLRAAAALQIAECKCRMREGRQSHACRMGEGRGGTYGFNCALRADSRLQMQTAGESRAQRCKDGNILTEAVTDRCRARGPCWYLQSHICRFTPLSLESNDSLSAECRFFFL